MGVTANFTMNDIRKRVDAFVEVVNRRQLEALKQLGELCVTEAKTKKGYNPQTGNLLSSTGYTIFVDGVAIHEAFEAEQGASGETATQGVQVGQNVAESVGKDTQGICLVVVAGMNYAKYVESKGYNVLSSAKMLAERELPRMVKQLIKDIKSV